MAASPVEGHPMGSKFELHPGLKLVLQHLRVPLQLAINEGDVTAGR